MQHAPSQEPADFVLIGTGKCAHLQLLCAGLCIACLALGLLQLSCQVLHPQLKRLLAVHHSLQLACGKMAGRSKAWSVVH
jgi:hypothetical protein